MRRFLFIPILIILLISACNTNPPTESIEEALGKVVITSNVNNAEIWIDNKFSNHYTPDTVSISLGSHSLQLKKIGYSSPSQNITVINDSINTYHIELIEIVSKLVLLEDFANVSCTPCVTSNKIIESVQHSYGKEKIAIIKYPTSFPSPFDPFYTANKPDSDNRRAYYNVNTAPTIIVDGLLRPLPQDSNMIKQRIDAQLEGKSKFKIVVQDSIISSNYIVNISVTLLDGSEVSLNDIFLHCVVTETDIEFSSPPGSNGETKFYNVMRVMLPSNQGESLSTLVSNQQQIFERSTPINSNWVKEKLNTVVFIQNKITKEVYQANSTF